MVQVEVTPARSTFSTMYPTALSLVAVFSKQIHHRLTESLAPYSSTFVEEDRYGMKILLYKVLNSYRSLVHDVRDRAEWCVKFRII